MIEMSCWLFPDAINLYSPNKLMKKSNSYSLQKINPNRQQQESQPSDRPKPTQIKNRLNFPTHQDSWLYNSVGRKHYYRPTHLIGDVIFNQDCSRPSWGNPAEGLVRNKSQGHFQSLPFPRPVDLVPETPDPSKKQKLSTQLDSLALLQKQFDRKLAVYKQNKSAQPPFEAKREIKLPAIGEDQRRMVAINSDRQAVLRVDKNPVRAFRLNPTYLSSQLGFI